MLLDRYPVLDGWFILLMLVCRCLYDLSREVQDIVRSMKITEDAQASRIRELERILREWNELFADPSSRLQAAGVTLTNNNPAALARHIVTLADALKSNDLEATAQRLTLEKEVSDLRNALRDAQRAGREETEHQLARVKSEADTAVAQAKAQNTALAEQLEHLRANIEQRVASDTTFRVEQETRSLSKMIGSLKEQLQQADAAAEAESRASALEIDRLKAQLASTRDDMRDMSARHEASYAEFTVRTGKDAADLRQEVSRLQRLLAATVADWEEKYEGLHGRWSHSTAAARVSSLEAQVLFYKGRVAELQELVQACQSALALTAQPPVSEPTLQQLARYRGQQEAVAEPGGEPGGHGGDPSASGTGGSSQGAFSQGPRVASMHGTGTGSSKGSVTFATRPMAGSPVSQKGAAPPPPGRARGGKGGGVQAQVAVVRHAAVDSIGVLRQPTETAYYRVR